MQSSSTPAEVWRGLSRETRRTIRDKHIHFYVIDAFKVAKRHAPTPSSASVGTARPRSSAASRISATVQA